MTSQHFDTYNTKVIRNLNFKVLIENMPPQKFKSKCAESVYLSVTCINKNMQHDNVDFL